MVIHEIEQKFGILTQLLPRFRSNCGSLPAASHKSNLSQPKVTNRKAASAPIPPLVPARHMVAQKIEKQELTKALEEKIPALAREHGGKLNAILRGSDAAFKQAKDRFLDQLEDHLRVSMTKLYAPEQITRRNKEVECQLSQNMADPDRQKGLDGLMRFMASAVGTAAGP
jgi:glutathionylspermidine synthase